MAALRWGILGASKFAREQMGPALHLAAGSMLTALATRSPDKAAPFEQLAPGITIFNSYDALLASPDIDAVYVPLPNMMHVERFPNVNQDVEQVQNFCEAVGNRGSYPWPLEDAQGTQKLIDSVYAAAREKN